MQWDVYFKMTGRDAGTTVGQERPLGGKGGQQEQKDSIVFQKGHFCPPLFGNYLWGQALNSYYFMLKDYFRLTI